MNVWQSLSQVPRRLEGRGEPTLRTRGAGPGQTGEALILEARHAGHRTVLADARRAAGNRGTPPSAACPCLISSRVNVSRREARTSAGQGEFPPAQHSAAWPTSYLDFLAAPECGHIVAAHEGLESAARQRGRSIRTDLCADCVSEMADPDQDPGCHGQKKSLTFRRTTGGHGRPYGAHR